jgi:hypothetical protein
MHACGDKDNSGVVNRVFLVPRCNPAPLLEPVDAALNNVSIPIPFLVEGNFSFSIRARRNDWLYSTPAKLGPKRHTIVALIASQTLGSESWTTAACALDHASGNIDEL